jgi:hypothetical protein
MTIEQALNHPWTKLFSSRNAKMQTLKMLDIPFAQLPTPDSFIQGTDGKFPTIDFGFEIGEDESSTSYFKSTCLGPKKLNELSKPFRGLLRQGTHYHLFFQIIQSLEFLHFTLMSYVWKSKGTGL